MAEQVKEFSDAKFADIKPKVLPIIETCPFKNMEVGQELLQELHQKKGTCPFEGCETMGDVKTKLHEISEKDDILKAEVNQFLDKMEDIYKDVSSKKEAKCPYFKHGNPLKE